MPKSSILVSSDHNTFTELSSESLANFRRACTCAFLRGGFACTAGFKISVLHGVAIVFLVTGPSCLEIIDKILLCNSGLIPHRSHDH